MDVILRDERLVQRGRLTPESVSCVLRDTGVGTWVLSAEADGVASRIREGWGVMIRDEGVQLLSGPITAMDTVTRGGRSSLTLSGVSDMHVLADRITLPDPTRAPDKQTTDYHRAKGAAEPVIRDLVRLNAGEEALAPRRSFGLVASTGGTLGSTVTLQTRLKPLLDEVQALALAGGVSVDVAQSGRALHLAVRRGRDLSRAVRFTAHTGALSSAKTSLKAPTVTAVVVGGQGQGADRALTEMLAAPSWGGRRIEVFQDRRDTTDAAEVTKAGRQTLTEGGASASCTLEVTETPRQRYGTHFTVGDTVTVDIGGGARITDRITAAEISWDESGRTAKITVGSHATDEDKAPAWLKKIRDLQRRIRQLEGI